MWRERLNYIYFEETAKCYMFIYDIVENRVGKIFRNKKVDIGLIWYYCVFGAVPICVGVHGVCRLRLWC